MTSKSIIITSLVIILAIMAGCSSNPVSSVPDLSTAQSPASTALSQIWGIYDVSIDPYNGTAEAVLDRSAMLTLSIVGLLNVTPAGHLISLNSVDIQPNYIDVDVNMTIKHPIADNPGLNVSDTFGVLIGDGAGTLIYNPDLVYSKPGVNMELLNADGYTRWFNPSEFTTPGLFGYVPGILSTPGYNASATLNPYKYFAYILGPTADLWEYLTNSGIGMFLSGSTVSRNMIVRFPTPGSFNFAYAVVVNWNDAPPFNAREAVAFNINTTDNIQYTSPGVFSGNLIADVGIFDWNSQLTGGVMEDYLIKIESTVLNSVYTASVSDMTPTASGSHFNTYHFDIPATNVTGLTGNEFWVIVEYPPNDYSNPLGKPNSATGTLAAFTRHGINVTPGTTEFDVSMVGFTFVPPDITVTVGSDVTWTNDSSFPHTASSDPLNPVAGGPESDTEFPTGLAGGQTYTWTVPDVPVGTVWYYHCRIHGFAGDGTAKGTGMTGSITVE
jgi:plastocyanin